MAKDPQPYPDAPNPYPDRDPSPHEGPSDTRGGLVPPRPSTRPEDTKGEPVW
jgi:hypothetical protein